MVYFSHSGLGVVILVQTVAWKVLESPGLQCYNPAVTQLWAWCLHSPAGGLLSLQHPEEQTKPGVAQVTGSFR